MFALHETTQRRVCRITFLVLCVAPTLLTLAAIAYCHRPWRQADWQQTLSERLHVRATLADITRPRPGLTVLTQVELSDLLTAEALGSVARLEIRNQGSRQKFQATQLMLQAEQLSALAKAISTWLVTGELGPLDFQVDQLHLVGDSGSSVELRDLSISSDTTSTVGQSFRVLASTTAGEPIEFKIESDAGLLRCTINTQQGTLPAWLVGELVPGVGACGEATFCGTASADFTSQTARGKLVGQFNQVDMQTWIGAESPHRLQGTAQLAFDQLTWIQDRIEIARGTLRAGPGKNSYSLLLNAKELCACVPGPTWETHRPESQYDLVAFDELALSFHLARTGIKLVGVGESGCIFGVEGDPLLFAPPSEPQATVLPVSQLVQLLDHRHQPGWIPATRGAVSMSEKLPLPGKPARE